jgi:hypothetical protein
MLHANVKSAIYGGLAATFVVAAAFAPRLVSGDRPEVSIQNTSADSDTTVSSAAETTTSTTAAPTTTSVEAPLKERVTKVEERVTIIEQTTTTTAPKPTTPTLGFYFEEPGENRFGRPDMWAIVLRPSAYISVTDFPNLAVTVNAGGITVPAEISMSSDGKAVGNITAWIPQSQLDMTKVDQTTMFMGRTSPLFFSSAVATWVGGSQQIG